MANEIKAKTNGSVSLFGNDLSKGFENMTQEDMALPFVRILGQLSPQVTDGDAKYIDCLLYTSPSPRDRQKSRMPSSA